MRLHKMPLATGRSLPHAKDWKQWVEIRLQSWCGAQAAGFAEAVKSYVTGGDRKLITNFPRENRLLGFEFANMLDGKSLIHIAQCDKTNGVQMLSTLNNVISATTSERTAALHERFAHPKVVVRKEDLQLALKQ